MTLYNQLFYYKLNPRSTHHPRNKNPHEWGATILRIINFNRIALQVFLHHNHRGLL